VLGCTTMIVVIVYIIVGTFLFIRQLWSILDNMKIGIVKIHTYIVMSILKKDLGRSIQLEVAVCMYP